MIRQYIYGWAMYVRAVYKMRTKKHGAGRQPWLYALRMGSCYRWLVDGQLRGGKGPRWLRPEIEMHGDLIDRVRELDDLFDRRWQADMRAIKRWQGAGPGRELTWPDHADLVVWLLEENDKLLAEITRLRDWNAAR